MRLIRFGAIALPQEGGEYSTPVQAQSGLVELRNGSFDRLGGPLNLRSPRLKVRFVVAGEDVDAVTDMLLREAGKGRRLLKGVLRDGLTHRQTWAKLLGIQRERRPGTQAAQPLIFEFEQDYPFWLASDDEPVYLDQGYVLDGAWNVTAGHVEQRMLTVSPHSWTIGNAGGARVPRGYLLVEPRSGATISNINVVNAANDMEFTYSGSLAFGDSLEIELLTKTVRKNGTAAYANFSTPAGQLDWMVLELGDNPMTITATLAGTVDLWWQWSRHYL